MAVGEGRQREEAGSVDPIGSEVRRRIANALEECRQLMADVEARDANAEGLARLGAVKQALECLARRLDVRCDEVPPKQPEEAP